MDKLQVLVSTIQYRSSAANRSSVPCCKGVVNFVQYYSYFETNVFCIGFRDFFINTVELRASNELSGTDHTGDIVSFTAVGSGADGTTRPWVCYTNGNPTNVKWQTPDGGAISTGDNVAPINSVVTRIVGDPSGVVLSRGTNYFSPDGDYCCVLTMDGTESERRCVTFSEY